MRVHTPIQQPLLLQPISNSLPHVIHHWKIYFPHYVEHILHLHLYYSMLSSHNPGRLGLENSNLFINEFEYLQWLTTRFSLRFVGPQILSEPHLVAFSFLFFAFYLMVMY